MENYIFIPILSILLFFSLPIFFSLYAEFDILKNRGSYKIKIFSFICITCRSFYIENNHINLLKKGKLTSKVPLKITKKEIEEFQDLQKILIKKITMKNLTISNEIGIANNPYLTAILYEIINLPLSIIGNIISAKKTDLSFENNSIFTYEEDNLYFSVVSKNFICLFDTLWTVVESKFIFNKFKEKYNERK